MARGQDHARLVAQIYAEAAMSPALAQIVAGQLSAMRATVLELIPECNLHDAGQKGKAFVTTCSGYN